MFIPYPMLIFFNKTEETITNIKIISTQPLWEEKIKKIKKNNNKSLGLGRYTVNDTTNIIISFSDLNGYKHELIAAEEISMRGMPKIMFYIKKDSQNNFLCDYKIE